MNMQTEESTLALRIRRPATSKEEPMKKAILGLAWALLVPAFAWAQSPTDAWNNLRQLRAGARIEVVDLNMRTLNGTFVSVSDEGLVLKAGLDEQTVPRAQVVRVSTRDTSKRKRNTLIGIAVGAGAGFGLGMLVDEGVRHVSGEGGSYVYAPVLTAAGAGLGAAAGGLSSGTRTIYRAPAGTTLGAQGGVFPAGTKANDGASSE
jgi:hypothetical protein